MFILFNRKKSEREKEAIAKQSWHVAILFFLVTVLGTVGIGYVVEKNLEIRKFDSFGYEAILNMPHPAWLDNLVAPVNYNFFPWGGAFIPSFLIVGVFLFLLWIFFRNRKLFWWAILSLAFGYLYATILFGITSSIIFRARMCGWIGWHRLTITPSAPIRGRRPIGRSGSVPIWCRL